MFLVGETMRDNMYGVKCRGCFRYVSQEAEQIGGGTAESWASIQILDWQAPLCAILSSSSVLTSGTYFMEQLCE